MVRKNICMDISRAKQAKSHTRKKKEERGALREKLKLF